MTTISEKSNATRALVVCSDLPLYLHASDLHLCLIKFCGSATMFAETMRGKSHRIILVMLNERFQDF